MYWAGPAYGPLAALDDRLPPGKEPKTTAEGLIAVAGLSIGDPAPCELWNTMPGACSQGQGDVLEDSFLGGWRPHRPHSCSLRSQREITFCSTIRYRTLSTQILTLRTNFCLLLIKLITQSSIAVKSACLKQKLGDILPPY